MARLSLYLPALSVASAALVACSIIALLALSEQKAGAAFPGQNGRIAYLVDDTEGDLEIYTMKPDGTDRTRLTNNSADDYDPDISPDGTQIAFVSLRSGRPKIYVMDADGTAVGNISGSKFNEEAPAWSPDGTQIAFASQQDIRTDIWIMDADGTDRRNLTNTGPIDGREVRESYPAWSPDGGRIAFEKRRMSPRHARPTHLFTIAVDGTDLERVTDFAGSEGAPDWSPSGDRLVYDRYSRNTGWRVYTTRLDGTDRTLIVQEARGAVWSPDGAQIAFTNFEGDIYKVDSDGSGEPVLIDGPADLREYVLDWGPRPAATPTR